MVSNQFQRVKGMRKPVIITEFSSNGLLDGIIKMKRNGCAQQDWDDTNIY